MLTVASGQVNQAAMPIRQDSTRNDPQQAAEFSRLELARIVARHRPRRALLLASVPDALAALPGWRDTLLVEAVPGNGREPGRLPCEISELPFQAAVFDLVVAHELPLESWDGALAELARVARGGGHLVLIGPGQWSHGRWRAARDGRQAAMQTARLCRSLHSMNFVVESCGGMGLAGLEVRTGHGWRSPLVHFSDVVVICARRNDPGSILRPIRFAQPTVVRGQAPVLDSVSREAVA